MRDELRETLNKLKSSEINDFFLEEAREYVRLMKEHGFSCSNCGAYEAHLKSEKDFYFEVSVDNGFLSVEIPFYMWHEDYRITLSDDFLFDRENWLRKMFAYDKRAKSEFEIRKAQEEARKSEYEMRKLRELQAKYPHISHESE